METQSNNYAPQPDDLEDVRLPEALARLAESLARNVHDTWIRQRLADGWRWGPKRDDEQRTHSCLVPYEQLTEEEKQYDRNTSIATLKFIISQGFKIVR